MHVFIYTQEGEYTVVKLSLIGLQIEGVLIVAALCQIISGIIVCMKFFSPTLVARTLSFVTLFAGV